MLSSDYTSQQHCGSVTHPALSLRSPALGMPQGQPVLAPGAAGHCPDGSLLGAPVSETNGAKERRGQGELAARDLVRWKLES